MQLSYHAEVRGQQRGIPDEMMEVLFLYGSPEQKIGGALKYHIRKRDHERIVKTLKHTIQLLDKAKNKAMIVSEDGCTVITVYVDK